MNCFNHPTQVAVAQCCDCSKGQCPNCAKLYSTPICKPCNDRRIKNERSRIIKEMLFTYVIGFLFTLFFVKLLSSPTRTGSEGIQLNTVSYIIIFYISAGIIAGWQTLNRITPRMFLFLPLVGWLIYFSLKLFLSVYVGLVMLPIRTIRNIRRLLQLNR